MDKIRVLILAPHLRFPLRNGADKYIAEKWSALPSELYAVQMVAESGLYLGSDNGAWTEIKSWTIPKRMQKVRNLYVLLRFLVGRKQYLAYKFSNGNSESAIRRLLNQRWDYIVSSYISTAESLPGHLLDSQSIVIESHNVDSKIYSDRAAESSGIRKALYLLAARRSRNSLARLPKNIKLCALGTHDAQLYEAEGFSNVVASFIGIGSSDVREVFPLANSDPSLAFIGSLNVQMNTFAIKNFAETTWPEVLRIWPHAKLKIMGSNPSTQFLHWGKKLTGVSVLPNPDDATLKHELQCCHAAIVPFADVNGQKLKAGLAIECGVPIISSIPMDGRLTDAGIATSANDIPSWIGAIRKLLCSDIQLDLAHKCNAFAKTTTWRNSALASLN